MAVVLLVIAGWDIVPSVAQPPLVSSTVTTVAPYKDDPRGLVAHLDRLQRHSVGRDLWQVWVCEASGEIMVIDPEDIVDLLVKEAVPYFRSLSDGIYDPVFVAGGEPVSIIQENVDPGEVEDKCSEKVAGAIEHSVSIHGGSTAAPDAVIIVLNANSIGSGTNAIKGIGRGMAPTKDPCLETAPGSRCDTFPDNERSVFVAGGRIIEGATDRVPLLVPS